MDVACLPVTDKRNGRLSLRYFEHPLALKLCVVPEKFLRCKNVLKVLYHRAKFGGAGISPAAGAAKNVKFFVCLFVCSSRSWMSEFVHTISPRRCWSTETILIPLDRGRFVVIHYTCVQLSQIAANWRHHKRAKSKRDKILGFSPPEGDRINRSRLKLASKCITWVCYSTPNFALSGKSGSVQ